MKTQSLILVTAFSSALAALPAVAADPAIISSGHVDIGVLYEGGSWDLHVHQEEPEPGAEYAPGDAIFRLGPEAMQPGGVPNTAAAIGFFGAAGSPLWVIRTTETEGVPFLGIGTEEMSASDWNGPLTLTVTSVEGPGNVFVWGVDAFGGIDGKVNTRDGVGAGDSLSVLAGSHAHFFWGFSAPGDYTVSLKASGIHAVDGAVTSDPTGYRFQVVPEPGPVALLVAGAAVCLTVRRRSTSPGGRSARA